MKVYVQYMYEIEKWLKENAMVVAEAAMDRGQVVHVGYDNLVNEWYIEVPDVVEVNK